MREAQLLGGRYRLVERLGEGGMSLVWRGHDEVLGRDVAVKMLTPRFAEDETVGERMRVEAQAVARLCHPHITAVYDYGETITANGRAVPFVVMELVNGVPLSARLADGGLHWTDAVTTCAQVASALATAHAHGIVHRDVTPSNVMLTRGGAKVVDFGISALAGERDACPDGSLFGTPAYLAPERLDGGAVEPATDVYALGVLLYKALAGRLPWPTMNTTQMLRAHRFAEPAPLPGSVTAEVPPEVVRLCRRCLAKRPQDRPASDEAAQALAEAVHLVVPLPSEEPVVALPVVRSTEQTTLSWQVEAQSDTGEPVEVSSEPEGSEEAEPDTGDKVRRRNAAVVLAAIVLLTAAAWAGVRAPVADPGGAPGAAGAPRTGGATGAGGAPRVGDAGPGTGGAPRSGGAGLGAGDVGLGAGGAGLGAGDVGLGAGGAGLGAGGAGLGAGRAPSEEQRCRVGASATWRQPGRTVVTRMAGQADRLDPGASTEIALTGQYVRADSCRSSGPMATSATRVASPTLSTSWRPVDTDRRT